MSHEMPSMEAHLALCKSHAVLCTRVESLEQVVAELRLALQQQQPAA